MKIRIFTALFLFFATTLNALTRPDYSLIDGKPTIWATEYGVKADGVTDDTVALASAVAAIASGGIIELPAGTVPITNLNLNKEGITLRGRGARSTRIIQKANSATGECIRVASSGITIEALMVYNSLGLGYENGIGIIGDNAIVRDCWVEGWTATGAPWNLSAGGGKGIHIDQTGSECRVYDNIVTGCMWGISQAASYLNLNAVTGNNIRDNYVRNCDIGVVVMALAGTATDTTPPALLTYRMNSVIRDNHIHNCRVGVLSHRVAGVTLENNYITNTFATTTMIIPATDLSTATTTAFLLSGCHETIVAKNSVTGLYTTYVDFSTWYSSVRFAAYNDISLNYFVGSASIGFQGNSATNNVANRKCRNMVNATTRYSGIVSDYDYTEENDPLYLGVTKGIYYVGAAESASKSLSVYNGSIKTPAILLDSSREIRRAIATPTTTTGNVGDIYFNDRPDLASAPVAGWICTYASGSVATWSAFGRWE